MKKYILFSIFYLQSLLALQLVVTSEKIDESKSRIYKDITLITKKEKIHFCLSLPLNIEQKKLYTIIVMAGLETGKKNLQYIYEMEDFAFIGYEYPDILKKKPNIFNIFSLRKKILNIPNEILEISEWVKNQIWSKKEISIAGFSFGAMFTPSIYHFSQEKNIPLGPGIIAYAGADLYPIFYANFKGFKLKRILKAYIASYLFKPLEPSLHLPYIKGDFLIINGINDTSIPFSQAKKLQKLTPYPKTIINLKSGHLSPTTTELIKKINDISRIWLNEKLNK